MICDNSIVLINPDKFQAQQPKIGMLSRKVVRGIYKLEVIL
jgi:hypothetical protein